MKEFNEELANQLAAEAIANPPEEIPVPTLERMQQLAAEVNDIDDRIAKNQARIDELNERRNAIMHKELVDMMDETHVQKLQVGGRVFKASAYYKALIPADQPNHPGLDWLEANEAGSLIKNSVIAVFPRGTEEEAKLAADLMKKRFQMAEVIRSRTVHHMTLTAWLKEVHQSGDPTKMPPLDMVGGIVGRIVKVSNAKE